MTYGFLKFDCKAILRSEYFIVGKLYFNKKMKWIAKTYRETL